MGLRSIFCSQRPFVVVRLLEHPERYTKMGAEDTTVPTPSRAESIGIIGQSYGSMENSWEKQGSL